MPPCEKKRRNKKSRRASQRQKRNSLPTWGFCSTCLNVLNSENSFQRVTRVGPHGSSVVLWEQLTFQLTLTLSY